MSDQPQDHWRELAELLGVAPEAPSSSKPKPEAAVQPQQEVAPAKKPELGREEPVQARRALPEVEENFDPDLSFRRPEPTREWAAQAAPVEAVTEAPPEEQQEPEPWERPEPRQDRPRGGRRGRGRDGGEHRERGERPERGERRGEPARRYEEPPAPEEHVQHEEAEEEEELREPVETADEEIPEEPETPAPDDDEIDEEDTLTDWNVPSWQELIASLYRPER